MLIGLLDDLWDKSDRYRRLGLELPPGDEPRTRDLQEHHQLVDLIEDGCSRPEPALAPARLPLAPGDLTFAAPDRHI